MKSKLIYVIGGSIMASSLLMGGTALAANTHKMAMQRGNGGFMHASTTPPSVFGVVTAINGNTLTVISKKHEETATTTYTVNTSSATVTEGFGKGAKALTLANITVGDHVAVFGTTVGTTVNATTIYDNKNPKGPKEHKDDKERRGFVGTVGTVTQNSFTLNTHGWGKDAATTTLNIQITSTTKILKDKNVATLADIQMGNMVMVEGTKNTNGTVTATTIRIATGPLGEHPHPKGKKEHFKNKDR